MLDRLMFVYFVQKKGFLDSDRDYLRNRLNAVQRLRGQGNFLSFYYHFLRRFFHEGLGQPPEVRDAELDELIGDVPLPQRRYLRRARVGTGIRPHRDFRRSLRETYSTSSTPTSGIWTSTRCAPITKSTPTCWGHIFERYVNQKQMGAYYTKEDITGYIAQNTIIPRLFDMARKDCAIAFGPGGTVWELLSSEDPDRYIYESMRRGVLKSLPAEIEAGIRDVSKRGGWNALADEAIRSAHRDLEGTRSPADGGTRRSGKSSWTERSTGSTTSSR